MPTFITATRVWLICPCGTAPLLRATNTIIATLLGEATVQQWGGFTYSSLNPSAFTGQFWHQPVNGQSLWIQDQNVLVIVDTPGHMPDDILPFFARLRDLVNDIYAQVGEPQAALWITAQPLSILWD